MSLSAPHTPELADELAELVRLEHERKIVEIQGRPAIAMTVIRDVRLADGVSTPVPHGLGRRASVMISPPRGASSTGRIDELRTFGGPNPAQYVVLVASGWGATITVDLWVL